MCSCSMVHGQEEGHYILRIGSLTLHSVGQLLPHQLQTGKFHTRDCIYPVSPIIHLKVKEKLNEI